MKRQSETRRRGVVLLLILGLMAMFAISVLTYMVVTSNMAETAQNAQKLDSVLEPPVLNDIDVAIRNLIIGSDNGSNPIGPFSLLENMYGDWRVCNNGSINTSAQFQARIAIFPNLGYAVLTPCTDFDGNGILEGSGSTDYYTRQTISNYFEQSGNVMTLMGLFNDPDRGWNSDVMAAWSSDVENTSAFVLEKVITDPSSAQYMGNSGSTTASYWLDHYFDSLTENSSNTNYYTDFDYWHFKIELTDDLKKFADDLGSNLTSFNQNFPQVTVRLNHPAYSGTGAGGFAPGANHDASFTPNMTASNGNLTEMCSSFAFWMNPSAPDMWPYYLTNNSPLSFRSYWAHLTDVNYDPRYYDNGGNLYYRTWNGTSFAGNYPVVNTDSSQDPVRMNSSYTAPDNRTPFLAHFYIDEEGTNANPTIPFSAVTPSFHRTGAFQMMAVILENSYPNQESYRSAYNHAGITNRSAQDAYLVALLRKFTPRPLPLDHWNFTGGNPDVDNFYYFGNDSRSNPNASRPNLTVDAFAATLGNSVQWDVDNDNDGIREGIWIPSGLPIRYDKNGTPYATMFSYTVVDLDGRVNVNTAGNWDQIPNKLRTINRVDVDGNSYTGNEHPYNYVDELADIWNNAVSGGVSAGTPFYTADNLDDTIGWNDDLGYSTKIATRGQGRGASGVLLYEALAAAFDTYSDDVVQTVATNLLWRRNLEQYNGPADPVDTTALSWGVNGLGMNGVDAPQPGCYYNNDESDDALGTRYELFRFMDPVVLGTPGNSDTLGDVKVVYPWRGKTTIDQGTNANLAPAFDWADTAFRSYDPLGAQIFSYAPRYSNNPYLAYQNVLSWQDSPYSIPMLERLLRPSDSDVATLPSLLIDDLRMNSDLYVDLLNRGNAGNTFNGEDVRNSVRERAKARTAFTTISSDVPAPALVFPENYEDPDSELRYGSYGFVSLIRRNVESELRRAMELKGLCVKETTTDASGNTVDVEGTNTYIDGAQGNSNVFYKKVDEITAYLASLLPKEILAGEKIDLNALSQKNFWLDVDYDDVNGGYKEADRDLHNIGLAKRMAYARGLYLVVMTLLYEDMNANRLYDPNNTLVVETTDAEGNVTKDESEKLSDYIEGSFDLLSFKGEEREKDLIGRELMATRIAQWCVNVVDFSDPDATMTPFFFDPTPFDGWWVDWGKSTTVTAADGTATSAKISWLESDDAKLKWQNGNWGVNEDPTTPFLFPSYAGVPAEQMEEFFIDAFSSSESYSKATSANHSVYYEPYEGSTYFNSNELIAKWASKKIEKLEDQTTDLGFRVVWGMERPDLVLTETLSFHDLGIADTDIAYDGMGQDSKTVDYGGDDTFDQVRRPKGSSYLEFYCTANPNVPQSNELYEYDQTANGGNGAWKLRLSKTTPVFTDLTDAGTTRQLTFPVWRVAISDSTNPRGLKRLEDAEDDAAKSEIRKSSEVVYRKSRNSVLEWLAPHKDGDKYANDINFFSMQPRQFRNYPMPTDSSSITNIANLDPDQGLAEGRADEDAKDPETANYLQHWKDYNLPASNVLGPAIAKTYDDWRLREVELDRILWFTHPEGDGGATESGKKLGTAGKFPDALRTFGNKSSENVYLKPNQYLVVGPEKKRAVGSAASKSTNSDEKKRQYGQAPDPTNFPEAYIDLENLALANLASINDNQKYEYLEAVSNIGGQGFNISEPLWTASNVDPYYSDQSKKINNDASFYPAADEVVNGTTPGGVRNVPFEIPDGWGGEHASDPSNAGVANFYDNNVKNYPIVRDEIFGLGTVPAYKSAFVQRVADPNRPYHPVMNPYITVDWNMMDLTVFTGEVTDETLKDAVELVNKRQFSKDNPEYKKAHEENGNTIKLARNVTIGLEEKDKTLELKDVFSSRKWGAQTQKMFAPRLSDNRRPNPWARAVKMDKDEKAGLQKPAATLSVATNAVKSPAFFYKPEHSLGFYNDHGKWGAWADETDLSTGSVSRKFFDGGDTSAATGSVSNIGSLQYKNLNPTYMNAVGNLTIYRGAPRLPFEHLVWNDAPFSNPLELMMVPASSAGRFGLEFVRESDNEGIDLSAYYKVDNEKKGALGSYGFYGYTDWYTDENIKIKKNETASGGGPGAGSSDYDKDDEVDKLKKKQPGAFGPYLNFFQSSKKPGDTLNLNNLFELVYVPSYYLGSKKLAGRDENGNLILDENGNVETRLTHREPGKVNINTLSKPVWNALVNTTDRLQEDDRLPGTPWDEFLNSRYPYYSADTDGDGEIDVTDNNQPYAYFQPAYTTSLWVQMNQSPAPVGSYSTLLAQQDCNMADDDSVKEEPLFDNIRQRYAQDSSGNTVYSYRYETTDATTGETKIETATSTDLTWIENNLKTTDEETGATTGTILGYEEVKTDRRGNYFDATAEMQRLSGLTTTRSNVFAVWVTVGYFEVERCNPGVNMPACDPDGNDLTAAMLSNPNYKWYYYYQAIYPDGYTYGKELGADFGETQRHRGFSIIDRSVPVDFRRGNSVNYEDTILMKHVID